MGAATLPGVETCHCGRGELAGICRACHQPTCYTHAWVAFVLARGQWYRHLGYDQRVVWQVPAATFGVQKDAMVAEAERMHDEGFFCSTCAEERLVAVRDATPTPVIPSDPWTLWRTVRDSAWCGSVPPSVLQDARANLVAHFRAEPELVRRAVAEVRPRLRDQAGCFRHHVTRAYEMATHYGESRTVEEDWTDWIATADGRLLARRHRTVEAVGVRRFLLGPQPTVVTDVDEPLEPRWEVFGALLGATRF